MSGSSPETRSAWFDQGAPVSTYTVARELGHESEAIGLRSSSTGWSSTSSGGAIGSSGWG